MWISVNIFENPTATWFQLTLIISSGHSFLSTHMESYSTSIIHNNISLL